MAGSHEVRGSIPLGSTTDSRGARRRRRAPLFLLPGTEKKARGARSLLGVAAGRLALARLPWNLLVSFGGVGAGRRPFLVRPDSPAHSSARAESASPPRMGIARPGRAPAPRARRPRRTCSSASRQSAAGRGRIRRLAASAPPSSKRPIGPRETAARRRRKRRRRNRGGSRFSGSGFANPGIDGLPEALDARRPPSRKGPVRRRGHRARQRGPEEGARLSAGARRPRPAPPRARPMRPAAQRGGDAFGAGLHGPRGVRECGIVPVENA